MDLRLKAIQKNFGYTTARKHQKKDSAVKRAWLREL